MIDPQEKRPSGSRAGIVPMRGSWLILAAAGAFALVAASLARESARGRTTAEGLRFEPASHRFDGPIVGGSTHALSVSIHNDSPIRIDLIGAASYCGPDGCATVDDLPQPIEPGSHATVGVEFRAPASGDFTYEFTFYTNSPDRPRMDYTISGTARAAEDRDAGRPPGEAGG